jgi:SnoaL-like protein
MSQDNVEIARRYFEGQARHEPSEWVAEFWESNGDYYPPPKLPEARPCHGSEEIVRFSTEFRAAWEGLRYVVKDLRAVGDDRVFVHRHLSAAGRTSGVPMEGDVYHCCWLRHGRFIRVEDHLTERGALHAIGLSGETLQAAGLPE